MSVGLRGLAVCCAVSVACAVAHAQVSQPAGGAAPTAGAQKTQGARPSFQASGIQGTTAPSGYAAGLSEADAEGARAALTGKPARAVDCAELQELEQRSVREPQNAVLLLELGRGYLRAGETAQAVTTLARAHALQPEDAGSLTELARADVAAGDFAGAEALLRSVPEAKLDAAALRVWGEAQLGLGKPELAVATLRKSLTADGSAANSALCAEVLLRAQPQAAEQMLQESVRRHAEDGRLWTDLGVAQLGMRDRQAGAASLLHAAELDRDAALPLEVLAGIHGTDAAVRAATMSKVQAFAVAHPQDSVAHYTYALALWTQAGGSASPEAAAMITEELRRSLVLQPDDVPARRLLGVVAQRSGQPREAVAELTRVVQATPGDAEAHYLLAMADRDLGLAAQQQREMAEFLRLKKFAAPAEDGTETAVQRTGPPAQSVCGSRQAAEKRP